MVSNGRLSDFLVFDHELMESSQECSYPNVLSISSINMWTSQVLGMFTSNAVAENLFQRQFACAESFNFKNPILMVFFINTESI